MWDKHAEAKRWVFLCDQQEPGMNLDGIYINGTLFAIINENKKELGCPNQIQIQIQIQFVLLIVIISN